MEDDAAKLLSEALRLPAPARAALADSLIDSLETEIDEDAEETWKQEISARLHYLEAGVATLAWDDVRSKLRSRFER
jgi:putative addiction module component (TIGR02574 family)